MPPDQFHRLRRGPRLCGQLRTPPGVSFRYNERKAQPMRRPFRPPGSLAREETLSHHDQNTIEDGKGMQDLPHIVQESSRQQVSSAIPLSLEMFEYRMGMRLFRRLQPAEQDDLRGRENRQQDLARHTRVRAEQGIPELAGSIGKAGYHCDRGIITL